MECAKAAPAVRKGKKKQVKDELDRIKQAEKKKRRLEKALATSAAIRSELEKKKQKKKEEQQKLDEEGAAIAEAVALHVLVGEESDDSCELLLKKDKESNPWDLDRNFDFFMGGERAMLPHQDLSIYSVEETQWVSGPNGDGCMWNERSTQEVENVVEPTEEVQNEVQNEVQDAPEAENIENDNQEHQDINEPSQELLSPEVDPNQAEEQEEARGYEDLFNAFDTNKTGKIRADKLYEIASILGKDTRNVDDVLKQNRCSKDALINFETYQQFIGELDRPNVSILESRASTRSQRVIITPDPKVIEFIKLLYAFQLKCEKEGKYGEAKLAQEKIEDIKVKEIIRQENNIRSFQEEELAQVENAQKEQFIEFNKVWDNYMGDYEATALASLEKLKEKHISEVEDLNEKLKAELAFTFKSSSQLLELRKKEANLAKMQKYSEAEKIQMQADTLEQVEKYNNERQIAEIIEKKILALRRTQQRGLTVLLKRIQKDRNQQLKNREQDSSKLVLKNRNLITELLAKHSTEAKNAIEVIKNNFSIHSAINLQARKTNVSASGKNSKSVSQNESFAKIDAGEADVL